MLYYIFEAGFQGDYLFPFLFITAMLWYVADTAIFIQSCFNSSSHLMETYRICIPLTPNPPLFVYELSKGLFDSNLETSRLTHNSATLAADHSYLQTCILTFPAISPFPPHPTPPFLSHSPFR